ncbi:hypothetical protein [Bifidobacterium choloepi]|uniref:Tetratricopeptide repeat protein n=1 Tax=Bifidobacterium choloepi TaxID=2614131 RepID=A0A6I5NEL6_9BIFI|nr:hypothetical protein [Bifidobacterium choloepi]NEG69794.1 hypothetical protein [Bifidobacterium choloepi]
MTGGRRPGSQRRGTGRQWPGAPGAADGGREGPTMDTQAMTLPGTAVTAKLAPLPGQRDGERFAVVTNAELPGFRGRDVEGYIVALHDRREVDVLAVVGADGHVRRADADGLHDDLWLVHWNGDEHAGAILVETETGDRQRTMGEYLTRDGLCRVLGVVSPESFGPYRERWLSPLPFLAVLWLALCRIPREQGRKVGAGGGRIVELFGDMAGQSLPDALDTVIWKGATAAGDRTAFERFAARQLVEAGAAQVRGIAAEHDLELVRLATTGMFWIRFDDDALEGLQRDVVLAVEAALNRLAFLDVVAGEHDNKLGLMATMDESSCYAATESFARRFAGHARFVDEQARLDNRLLGVEGASGVRGGNWDAMTRFGAVAERMALPFRLDYRFDVDTAAGVAAVRCTVPTAMMFPATGTAGDVRHLRPAAASAYAFRLAALMAHAAFRSSLNVTGVQVDCHAGSLADACVLSLRFRRTPFLMEALPAMLDGRLDSPRLDADPLAIYRLLGPARYSARFAADRGLTAVEPLPLDSRLAARRLPLWRDERPLPAPLRTLLRADRACELDVMHDDAVVRGSEVTAIVRENEDSPLTAAIELEATLLRLEDERRGNGGPPDDGGHDSRGSGGDDGDADRDGRAGGDIGASDDFDGLFDDDGRIVKPLYCERPLMRLMVGLDGEPGDGDAVRYRKVPDALFDATLLLSRIDAQAGNHARAVERQRACAAMAPTTAQPLIDLSMTFVEQGEAGGEPFGGLGGDDSRGDGAGEPAARGGDAAAAMADESSPFSKAAATLRRALAIAVMPVDIAFIYYRLAFAYWQLEMPQAALACYGKTLAVPGTPFYDHAVVEVSELLAQAGGDHVPTDAEATATLRLLGIPVAPSARARNLIAEATIGLVDAGFPRAADEGAWFLGRLVDGDVVSAMSPSLRWGTGDPVGPTQ